MPHEIDVKCDRLWGCHIRVRSHHACMRARSDDSDDSASIGATDHDLTTQAPSSFTL